MYKCCNCGKSFKEPKIIAEYRGEFWGMPCFEDEEVSPCCEDAFVDIDKEKEEEK